MATTAHVGTSYREDSAAAGREAIADALTKLDGRRPNVALVYATADHDQTALLDGLRSAIPGVPLVGCSGEGVIAHDESTEAFSAVAVMLVASDRIHFATLLVEGYGDRPAETGRRLAELVNHTPGVPRCLCLMPDGLQGNCTEFLRALHEGLAMPIPVVGGLAADAMAFERTYQYVDDRVVSGSVAALVISGDTDVALAVSHGCSPIGTPRRVTKSDSGWIREIDGQPAWGQFKEYLDDSAEDLNAEGIVHLCIGEPLADPDGAYGYDPYVIRTPLQLDKASGALFFPGGGLTEGDEIQFTRRNPEKIRSSAKECAEQVLTAHGGRTPDLVLQFDCAGRGRILWGACAAAEIVVPLRKVLGANTPWLGFHTYGEIAPIGGRPYYHNYTVALCALYERPAA
jgi:hypothetical protein